MKTTFKQLTSYLLVAVIAGMLVGCSPEQLNNVLTFDSRFYVSAGQDAFVGFGQIPGGSSYVIGTADLVGGEWDIKAGLGTASATNSRGRACNLQHGHTKRKTSWRRSNSASKRNGRMACR